MTARRHYTPAELARMRRWGSRADRVMEFLPPVCTAVMVAHDVALCFGYRWPWTEAIVIMAAVVLMLLFSFALGFCRLHRAFILYNWLMLFCIHFERVVGFRSLLHPMHYLMAATGLTLLALLYRKKRPPTSRR